RLAFQAERDEKAADLRLRRLAGHDLVHDRAGLVPLERAPLEEQAERALDHRSRNSRQRSGPWGVRTLSGWNWTPSTGSARCRTAITSPSGLVAEPSRSSVMRVAASEW